MRVSGGKFKGRNLRTLSGLAVRPTADKIKQAIFNILMNDITDADVLDLFAGSGALGIEALSRGAADGIFVESDEETAKVLKSNLKNLGIDKRIIIGDYDSGCKMLSSEKQMFDLVFADPPYLEITPDDVIKTVTRYGLLRKKGLLIIEHKAGQPVETKELTLLKQRKFGQTEVSFLGNI
jgi:16S rRNA (guanine(966)-N(2))-methyltransferase RsmD